MGQYDDDDAFENGVSLNRMKKKRVLLQRIPAGIPPSTTRT